MVLTVQILGILFGVFMLYLTFLHRKRTEFTLKEAVFWSGIWILLIIFSSFPQILDYVRKPLQISRIMDLFIIIAFLFLTGIIFRTYALLRRNQKRIEEIVRKLALEKEK